MVVADATIGSPGRSGQRLIEDGERAPARIGVQLDTIFEPPDEHFLCVQSDPHLTVCRDSGDATTARCTANAA